MTKNTVKKLNNTELLTELIRNHATLVKCETTGHKPSKKVETEYDICLQEICKRLDIEYDEKQFYF